MTGRNFIGTFAQTADRIRLDLAARRALKQRVIMVRILARDRWLYDDGLVRAWPLRTMGGAQ